MDISKLDALIGKLNCRAFLDWFCCGDYDDTELVNETCQAPHTPPGGTIPLKNDETPPTSSSSFDASDTPESQPFLTGFKGKTQLSPGSSKEENSKMPPPSSSSMAASVAPSKSPVVPVVTPDKPPRKAPPVPSVGLLSDESSLEDNSDHSKRKRGPDSPGKKSPPETAATRPPSPPRSNGSNKSNNSTQSHIKKKQRRKTYVDTTDKDVLFGRGGCSNHHPGNKPYLEHVRGLQMEYKTLERKEKKPFSEAVVRWVKDRGGRFLKRDVKDGPWYEVTDVAARKKVSQALREDHTPEGRAKKRSRSKNAKKRL